MSFKLSFEKMKAHEGTARGLAIVSPDSFLTSGYDKLAHLWVRGGPGQTNEFIVSKSFVGHTGYVYSVALLSPDSTYPNGALVTGASDSNVIIWDLANASVMYVLKGHRNAVSAVATTKSGLVLSGSWDHYIIVWNKDVKLATLTQHTGSVQSIFVDETNGIFASASSDSTVNVYSLTAPFTLKYTLKGHTQPARDACFLSLKNETYIASVGNDGLLVKYTSVGAVQSMQTASNLLVYSLAAHPSLAVRSAPSSAADPKTELVATAGEDRNIALWDFNNLNKIQSLTTPSPITSVRWLNSTDMVSVSDDGAVRVWSCDPMHQLPPQALAAYDKRLLETTVSGISLKALPTEDALRTPGKKDGEVKVIRKGVVPEAYIWNAGQGKWEYQGEVLQNGPGGGGGGGGGMLPNGKYPLDGEEYDFVFNIDLEGSPNIPVGVNAQESVYVAAQRVIDTHRLHPEYLIQIANFIRDRVEEFERNKAIRVAAQAGTEEAQLQDQDALLRSVTSSLAATATTATPSTQPPRSAATASSRPSSSSASAASSSSYSAFAAAPKAPTQPKPDYYFSRAPISFRQMNLDKMLNVIRDNNLLVDEKYRLNASEIEIVVSLVNSTIKRAPQIEYAIVGATDYALVHNKMLFWDDAHVFPVFDLLRLMTCASSVLRRYETDSFFQLRTLPILLSRGFDESSSTRNRILCTQTLANMLVSRNLKNVLFGKLSFILEQCTTHLTVDSPGLRTALATLLFNIVSAARLYTVTLEGNALVIASLLGEILSMEKNPEGESAQRAMQAFILLITLSPETKADVVEAVDFSTVPTFANARNEDTRGTAALLLYELNN